MNFAEKYNRQRKFSIDSSSFEFETLANLYTDFGASAVYPLKAIYLNKRSKYGVNPVFATGINAKGVLVNVPKHLMDTVNSILSDDEAIDLINAGKVGFRIYVYHDNNHNKDCLSVEFVNM